MHNSCDEVWLSRFTYLQYLRNSKYCPHIHCKDHCFVYLRRATVKELDRTYRQAVTTVTNIVLTIQILFWKSIFDRNITEKNVRYNPLGKVRP